MKKFQVILVLLIAAIALILAIKNSFSEEQEPIVENTEEVTPLVEEEEQEPTTRVLKLNEDTLEVYEPLVSSQPVARFAEPVGKNDDVSTYRIVGDRVYYKQMQDGFVTVASSDFAGAEQLLDFTQVDTNKGISMDGFVMSDDETKVAWTTQQLFEGATGFVIESKLFVADVESEVVTELYATSFENREAYLLPVRWSNDLENLYFTEEPSGLGGYILFKSWYDLKRINLESKEIISYGGGIYDISTDEQLLTKVTTYASGEVSILAQKLVGEENYSFLIPLEGGFTSAGNVYLSPSGTRIAYDLVANNPDEEKYRVVVGNLADGETVTVVEQADFFPNVVRWLDDETLLLDANGVYYLVNADGSDLRAF